MIQGEGRKEIKAIEKRVRKIIFKYKSIKKAIASFFQKIFEMKDLDAN